MNVSASLSGDVSAIGQTLSVDARAEFKFPNNPLVLVHCARGGHDGDGEDGGCDITKHLEVVDSNLDVSFD